MIEPLPDSALARAAENHVREVEPAALFHHSVRVFVYARAAAAAAAEEEIDLEALFVSALFHDIGATPRHDGPQRFEVEGADAAVRFLRRFGWTKEREDAVWEAIALHTSPGIAERRGPIARYTRLGVRTDFGSAEPVDAALRARVEADYPRLDVETALTEAVVAQARRHPAKAPNGSWVAALVAGRPL